MSADDQREQRGLDLDELTERWLKVCGYCDAGLPMGCSCCADDPRPAMRELIAAARERDQLRAEIESQKRAVDRWNAALREAKEQRDLAVARAIRYAEGLRTFHGHAALGPKPYCEPDKYIACEAEAWLDEQQGRAT